MAKTVAKLLHPHFVKEEEFALPPLGVLSAITKRRLTADMSQALAMTEKLKRELPRMLREHKMVMAALKKLSAAARKEKKPEYVRFAEKLAVHAKTEEEVLYPAAILVGELLKLRFEKRG